MKKREILRASFNTEDEHEKQLFLHANKNSNVSAYLKRLIFLDMVGKGTSLNEPQEEIEKPEEDDMSTFV